MTGEAGGAFYTPQSQEPELARLNWTNAVRTFPGCSREKHYPISILIGGCYVTSNWLSCKWRKKGRRSRSRLLCACVLSYVIHAVYIIDRFGSFFLNEREFFNRWGRYHQTIVLDLRQFWDLGVTWQDSWWWSCLQSVCFTRTSNLCKRRQHMTYLHLASSRDRGRYNCYCTFVLYHG